MHMEAVGNPTPESLACARKCSWRSLPTTSKRWATCAQGGAACELPAPTTSGGPPRRPWPGRGGPQRPPPEHARARGRARRHGGRRRFAGSRVGGQCALAGRWATGRASGGAGGARRARRPRLGRGAHRLAAPAGGEGGARRPGGCSQVPIGGRRRCGRRATASKRRRRCMKGAIPWATAGIACQSPERQSEDDLRRRHMMRARRLAAVGGPTKL